MKPVSPSKLAAAYAMDLAFGDPPRMPHPVRWMGSLISAGERIASPGRRPAADFVNGIILSLSTVAVSWAVARLAIRRGGILEIALAWTTLATGSLVSEAGAVIDALELGEIEGARSRLSMIVGRDTKGLDESEIARAVIEAAAESLCDGVVAPLLYLSIGGAPLAMAYKAVNTLDSMIGHIEHPHTYFGRFAARLDDAANFFPARLTAAGVSLAAGVCGGSRRGALQTWLADGYKHPSPNAGQCEAAMSGALGVRLGGTNYYLGNPSRKPVLGQGFPAPAAVDARRAIRLARVASALAFIGALSLCAWKRRR